MIWIQWLRRLYCQEPGDGFWWWYRTWLYFANHWFFYVVLSYSEMLKGSMLVPDPARVLRQCCRELQLWCARFFVFVLHHAEERPIYTAMYFEERRRGGCDPKEVLDNLTLTWHVSLFKSTNELKKELRVISRFVFKRCCRWAVWMNSSRADVTLTCKRFNTTHRMIVGTLSLQNHSKELWSLFNFVFLRKMRALPVYPCPFYHSNNIVLLIHNNWKLISCCRQAVSAVLQSSIAVFIFAQKFDLKAFWTKGTQFACTAVSRTMHSVKNISWISPYVSGASCGNKS